MADDIVPLGFDVDTSGLQKAKTDAASAGTEIGKLGDTVDKLSHVVGELNTNLKPLAENVKQTAANVSAMAQAQKQASGTGQQQTADTSALTKAIAELTAQITANTAHQAAAASAAQQTGTAAAAAAGQVNTLGKAMTGTSAATAQAAHSYQQLNQVQASVTLSTARIGAAAQAAGVDLTGLAQKTAAAQGAAANAKQNMAGLAKTMADTQSAAGGAAKGHEALGQAQKNTAQSASMLDRMMAAMNTGAHTAHTGAEALSSGVGKLNQAFGGGGGGEGGGGLNGVLGLAQRGLSGFAGFVTGSAIGAVAGLSSGVLAVGAAYTYLNSKLAESQDEYRLLSARVNIAVGDQALGAQATKQVVEAANTAGVAIEGYADTFTRFERIRNEMGLTTEGVLKFTDAITKLGKLSGATPMQTQMGLLQLSQGLGSGRLQGQDLKLMTEDMPAVGQYIAKGLGVGLGQLKTMGTNGELTPEKVVNALMKQLDEITRKTKELPETTEQATQRMSNNFTKLKASLGEVLMSTQLVQAGINATNRAMVATTNRLTDNYSIAELQKLKTELQQDQVSFKAQGYSTVSLDSRLKEVQALIDKDKAAKAAAAKEVDQKPVQDANNVKTRISETDDYAKKQKELQQNIHDVSAQLTSLNVNAGKFDPKDRADKIDFMTRALARLNEEMEKSAPASAKLAKSITDATADRATFGLGNTSMGAGVRTLEDDQKSHGLPPLPPGFALGQLTKKEMDDQTDALTKGNATAARTRSKLAGIGLPGSVNAGIDATNEAESYRLDTFGTGAAAHTKEADAAVSTYRQSLLAAKQAQVELNDATARFGANNAYKSAQAALKAAGQGSYAMDLARQESARNATNSATPGLGNIQFATWKADQQAQLKSQLADVERENEQLRQQTAAVGSPNGLLALRSQAAVGQIERSMAPGDNRDKLVAATREKPQLEQDDKLATETNQLQRQVDLAREKESIYSKGGADAEVQLAVAEKRYELDSQGISVSNAYYQKQVALTAELTQQNTLLNQQKQISKTLQQTFGDTVKVIGTDFMKMFDTLFTTTGSKGKVVLSALAGMAKDVSDEIIQDAIIKPLQQMATSYGSGLLKTFLSSLGGGATGLSSLGLGTSSSLDVTGTSTSSMVGLNSYGFTTPTITANAKGGAYDSPSLSAYSGQVLNKPTYFAFAQGGGVAGEAGPEGILPLKRGADGSLGVRSYGGGGGGDSSPNITVVDQRTAHGSQPVQTSTGKGSDGKQFIQVLVRDTVRSGMSNGEYDSTMQNNFQVSRPVTKR